MTTRDDHVAWCKERALAYFDNGALADAVASMCSDLQKHPETRAMMDKNPELAMIGVMYLVNSDASAVRRWIEGFNG